MRRAPISAPSSFAQALRRHRRAAGLTLEQLSEASGVSVRTLSDMERGRSTGPQHRTVTALAQALSLPDEDRQQLIDWAREGRLRDHWARPGALAELPRSVDDFTGRSAELAWADDFMRAGDRPGAAGVALVTGAAGLGKTTFAVRTAHVLRPGFPGGAFFVDLFGMSARPLPAQDALSLLLRALGTAERDIPHAPAERASLYRSLLAERRVLVVLDNAGSEEQLRPLLPGGGASRVLATSRRLLAGLEGVHRLGLGPLPPEEAAELLSGIVGRRGSSDGDAAISELAAFCGGLPLALRIVGNRLVSRPSWPAAEFAYRLADEERRLDQLKAGDLKIATAFGMSYQQLAGSAQQVFRRLALVPGRDFDADLAAVLGSVPVVDAWDALDDLVDLGLLQDGAFGRYRFHDLVRLFARERLIEEEATAEREASAERMTSWLVRMATLAGRWFEPAFGPPDQPDADLADLPSADRAERWLRADADNWLSALRHAAAHGQHALVLECAEAMHWFSDRWISWPHWAEVFTLAAGAAAALREPARQATQLNYLAWVHSIPPSEPEAVLRVAAQALELATASGATAQIAESHQYLAGAYRRLGRHADAVDSAAKAAELYQDDGDVLSYWISLGTLAECLRVDGQHEAALTQLRLVQTLASQDTAQMASAVALEAPRVLAANLMGIGRCLLRLGRHDEAITTLTEAVPLLEQAQLPHHRAVGLQDLATALGEGGRTSEALEHYARAADAFDAVGDAAAAQRCREQAAALA
ncbi:tetratricopeptide repeat protein [Nonomuraea sp. NPDC050556]|uniref:tetratricopeptide repeat protein n=1 Tax=Nonomuraea sp. NPDC050556 TaxID=3364369 RepID=UPI0037908A3E